MKYLLLVILVSLAAWLGIQWYLTDAALDYERLGDSDIPTWFETTVKTVGVISQMTFILTTLTATSINVYRLTNRLLKRPRRKYRRRP